MLKIIIPSRIPEAFTMLIDIIEKQDARLCELESKQSDVKPVVKPLQAPKTMPTPFGK